MTNVDGQQQALGNNLALKWVSWMVAHRATEFAAEVHFGFAQMKLHMALLVPILALSSTLRS